MPLRGEGSPWKGEAQYYLAPLFSLRCATECDSGTTRGNGRFVQCRQRIKTQCEGIAIVIGNLCAHYILMLQS